MRNVLSLFDGLSGGQIALNRAGIKYEKYYASEIDKHAIKVTMDNYPDTIQLGDITHLQIHKKVLHLSEVSKYIKEVTEYDLSNLQDTISEQEVLHRLNEKETFATTYGTQVKEQKEEISKNTAICIYGKVWFFKNTNDHTKRKFDIIRSGKRRKETNKGWLESMLEHSFWWNGNRQYKSRDKEESIRGIKGTRCKGRNKRKIKTICKETICNNTSKGTSKGNGAKAVQRSYKKNALSQCNKKNRPEKVIRKKEKNRYEKTTSTICHTKKELHANDAINSFSKKDRNKLSVHKKMEITVVTCEWGFLVFKGSIQVLLAGSPCQGFSFAGKQLNFEDPRSKLFFEYVRLLKEVKPKYFLLENVIMKKKHEHIISSYLEVMPVYINSALISAQERKRVYWTNIPGNENTLVRNRISQPEDKGILLKDILEDNSKSIKPKQRIELKKDHKSNCLSTVQKDNLVFAEKPYNCNFKQNEPIHYNANKFHTILAEGGSKTKGIAICNDVGWWRKLTPIECARLQTVPDKYCACVSNSQQYKMLGNGWTIDVIVHIFKNLK